MLFLTVPVVFCCKPIKLGNVRDCKTLEYVQIVAFSYNFLWFLLVQIN